MNRPPPSSRRARAIAKRAEEVRAELVERVSLEQRAYGVLQQTLHTMGHARDGLPWECLSDRERAIWTARVASTRFIIAETVRELIERAHTRPPG